MENDKDKDKDTNQDIEPKKAFNFDLSFIADPDKELNGVWDEIYMDGQTLDVKVARDTSPAYKKMLRHEMRKYERKLDKKDDRAIRLFEEIMVRVMAKTMLLDWGELEVNGEILKRTVENAEIVLRNEDFRTEVMEIAKNFAIYKQEETKKIKGNS